MSSSVEAQYDRAFRDLHHLENKAVSAAKKIVTVKRRDALRALLNGSSIVPHSGLHGQIANVLADAMTAAYLTATKRVIDSAGVGFGPFESMIERLTHYRRGDVAGLKARQRLRALVIANNVSKPIDDQLRSTVADLISQGAHVREGVRVLKQRFNELGIAPRSESQLETIFRTQVQVAYNAGKWTASQAPVVQRLLWGYRYATAGDNRVRKSHRELDGTTLPKDDKFWVNFWPPNGWNCRCQVIPLYRELKKQKPPKDAAPDEGFDFNPGLAYS